MTHSTHHSLKSQGHRDHSAKVNRIAGHHGHGEKPETKKEVKAEIKHAMRAHDSQQHGGHHTRLPRATGGAATIGDGEAPARPRLDRPGRKAGGGAHGKKKGAGNHVNVIIAGHGGAGGPPAPAMAPPGAMPPKPPMPPPAAPMAPPGAPPPGVMPGGPPRPPMMPPGGGAPMPPMRAAGGRTARATGGMVHMTAGAKSGVGRLEKEHAEKGRAHHENMGETEHFENKPAVKKAG